MKIGIVGFGEVGSTLATDFAAAGAQVAAFDVAAAAQARAGAIAVASAMAAARDAELVFMCVTAGSVLEAMRSLEGGLAHGPFVVDVSSVAPAKKIEAGRIVESEGGRYVEAAVMASIGPKRLATPMLLGGLYAEAFIAMMAPFTMDLTAFSEEVGRASSVAMCRSVMVDGIEALVTESMLAARHFGIEAEVLKTLGDTLPHPDWAGLARYVMSRTLAHGRRRAEEMREVSATMAEAGVEPVLSRAIAERQGWAGRRGAEMGEARSLRDLGALLDTVSATGRTR